jgi:hypothetical protein
LIERGTPLDATTLADTSQPLATLLKR